MWRGGYQRLVCIAVLVLSVFNGSYAYAAAAPAYNGRMNAAVSSVIQHKASKWGFAANDPRIPATFNGVAAGLTVIAGGVVAGGVATVGWPALLIGAGVSAVVTGALSLGADAAYKWLFNSDGSVSTEGAVAVDPSLQPGHCYTWASTDICAGTKEAVCSQLGGGTGYTWGASYTGLTGCVSTSQACGPSTASYCLWGTPTIKMGTPTGGASGVTNATVPDAVSDIPDAELEKPVSNEMLAAAVNAAWKSAAAETGGLPWTPSDPVTPNDIADWKATNPEAIPNVGDLIAPAAPPSGGTSGSAGPSVPITPTASSPTPTPSPGPAPSPGSGTPVDLGPNPNIPPPALEATPTAQQILEPLLNLMPGLQDFSVPAHSSVCPTGGFDALGQSFVISSHCTLIEQNRALIEGVMILIFTLAATFIVLRA